MKIIDAHLHFWPGEPYFDEIALAAEHQNTEKHLYEQYQAHEIIMGIVMGNDTLEKNGIDTLPIYGIASDWTAILLRSIHCRARWIR